MNKIAAFSEIVTKTMNSREEKVKKKGIALLIQTLLQRTTPKNSYLEFAWEPYLRPGVISFDKDNSIEIEKISIYCKENNLSPFLLIDQLSGNNSQHKLTNTFSFILWELTQMSGSNSVSGSHGDYSNIENVLKNLFRTNFDYYSISNIEQFRKELLIPFSVGFNQVIEALTGKVVNNSPFFCSQTNPHRFKEHELIFELEILPKLLVENSSTKRLHIASLGSSLGLNLYDIYKILIKHKEQLKGWEIILEARDISTSSLNYLKEVTFATRELAITLQTIPTMLGDSLSLEEIFQTSYDVLFFRNIGMYLKKDILEQYQQNLQSKFILTTNDYHPKDNYRLVDKAGSDTVYKHITN